MRNLTDHITEGDSVNHQLTIEVLDEPGAGGANHRYLIAGYDEHANPSLLNSEDPDWSGCDLLFQNGAIKEAGVNGITQEALLAIVIDRLRSFQQGPFACIENAMALDHCMDALKALKSRTKLRMARGVEGTHQK